jgi:hypothetical protein
MNPLANAPWWNMLFEIAALPIINAVLPMLLAALLAVVLIALGRMFHRSHRQVPPAE